MVLECVCKIKSVDDLERVLKVKRDEYPKRRLEIIVDKETKMYKVNVLEEEIEGKQELEVPVFLETQVVYGDTDSVMCRFKYNRDSYDLNRYDTFRLAKLAGEELTRDIFARPPIEMEFEKVFNPFLLKGKKNYVGKKFDDFLNPLKMTKLHVAGVASTRRNYNDFYKEYADKIYECFLERRLEWIKPITKEYLECLEGYNVEWNKLVISSSLAANYKQENMPHLEVVRKRRGRNEEVQIGDRISFVFIEGDMKIQKYLKAEDPVYAQENGLRFDRAIYIEHIAKPILGFMTPLLKNEYPDILQEIFGIFNESLVLCKGKRLPLGTLKMNDD